MKKIKRVKALEGKKILKAWIEKISEQYDDEPFLFLKMEDGSLFKIISWYGAYTGKSEDEYPRFIEIKKIKKEAEP